VVPQGLPDAGFVAEQRALAARKFGMESREAIIECVEASSPSVQRGLRSRDSDLKYAGSRFSSRALRHCLSRARGPLDRRRPWACRRARRRHMGSALP